MLFYQVIVAICKQHLEHVLEINYVNTDLLRALLIILVDKNLVH